MSRTGHIIGITFRYLIPLAVTVGLCWVLFRDIDMPAMWADMRACDYRWILLGFIPATMACVFRALRWRLQLRATGINPPLRAVILSFFGTYAVNIVFPRLGEVWRSGYIARRQGAPFAVVFGSMVSDRLADTVTVLLMALVTAAFAGPYLGAFVAQYPAAYDLIRRVISSPLTYVSICVALLILWWAMRRSRGSTGIIGRIRRTVRSLWDGFAAIARMHGKWQWLLWTVLVWFCYFAQTWLAFNASPLTRQVLADNGIIAVIVCYVLTTISMGVPSNGGIGPYQTVMRFGLSLFVASGMAQADFNIRSLSFANLLLGSNTLLFIILGLMTFIAISRDRHSSGTNGPNTQSL